MSISLEFAASKLLQFQLFGQIHASAAMHSDATSWGPEFSLVDIYTIWLFNIAMENHHL